MVQLSPSPTLSMSPPPERSDGGDLLEGHVTSLDLGLEVYPGYDTYIEDGLICLKHKVRNLEKKKLKLEDYKTHLKRGKVLNRDQMAAVEKYDEVLQNLTFVQELHKTLDGLTQNLLRAQRKAVKHEQMLKMEEEKRRLRSVLHVQQVLRSLDQDGVKLDLLSGLNQAPLVPAQMLYSLNQLSGLLGLQRDHSLRFEEQMEKAAGLYMDLLNGKDKPVAGSTFKLLKQELDVLMNSSYFRRLPPPKPKPTEVLPNATKTILLKSKPTDSSKSEYFNTLCLSDAAPVQSWEKTDFSALKEREPPDNWDTAYTDSSPTARTTLGKPWRGAATLIPKNQGSAKKQSNTKRKKEKKPKREDHLKSPVDLQMSVEVFNSPSVLPKDPVLRKRQLEDLMTEIHGSFSFMQDSVLDSDGSPTNGHQRLKRRPSGSPSPLAHSDLRSPGGPLPKTLHSTPLPARRLDLKQSLTNGDRSSDTSDLELSKDLSLEPLCLSDSKVFPSPPLYCREPALPVSIEQKTSVTLSPLTSTPPPPQTQSFTTPPSRCTLPSAQFKNIQSVFKVSPLLPPNGELPFKKGGSPVFVQKRFASTQTPPEFALLDEEPSPVYSVYGAGSSGHIFLSPSQSTGGRSGYFPRGSGRGTTRGSGKALTQNYRSSGPTVHHLRDSATFYTAQEAGYQQSYRRGGGRPNTCAAWSDSSQVSSPDRDVTFTIVDSGHGDSLSVSALEIPLTPHDPRAAPLLSVPLYPLSQPLRIAFTASRTANFAPGNLDQPIVFDQLHSNIGDMYDTHIGRFTCPATGTYVFLFHILKLAINVPLYINLMKNEEVMVSAYANDGAPDHETASNHAILPLFQGDQVWLRLHRGAIYGSTWKYSTFSGFLLYQD